MNQEVFPITEKEATDKKVNNRSEINRNAIFPSRLRKLREEKGVSQTILAEELGVTKSTISLYENGDTVPDAKTVVKLAKFYEVSLDYLLGQSENKNRDNIDIGNELGLSDNSITVLKNLKDNERENRYLNKLLENKFADLLYDISRMYQYYTEQLERERNIPGHKREHINDKFYDDLYYAIKTPFYNSEKSDFLTVNLDSESYADFELERISRDFKKIVEKVIDRMPL